MMTSSLQKNTPKFLIWIIFFFKFSPNKLVTNLYIQDNHILVYYRETLGITFFISNVFLSCGESLMCSNLLSKISFDYRFVDKFKNLQMINKTKAHAFVIYQNLKMMIKHSFTKINQFIDLTAVDMLGKHNSKNRFFIYYIFFSTWSKTRFFFSFVFYVSNALYSLNDFLPSTTWAERECFDMFGIKFKDNKDFRRILTDYGFRGFPLRKDFPVTGFLQVKFDEVVLNVVYEKLNLMQLEREISFINPWNVSKKEIQKVCQKSVFFVTSDSYVMLFV